jgi:alkylation response protein AidB-like acyl-CoA dehydrogenase
MSTTPPTPAAHQAALHEWLAEHGDDFERARVHRGSIDYNTAIRDENALQRALWDADLFRWGWPEFVGGLGGTAVLRAALYEQLCLEGFRIPHALSTLETLGPVMCSMAPEVAATYLGACISGREIWCQGFSEPEAGSDLASLRCKAVPDGDGWRITGQKLWSSVGTMADRIAMLVRTGESGHRGISMLLVDMDAEGLEARPTRASTGRDEFTEEFFDNVYAGPDRLIGEVNRGWYVAMDLLQWERGMYAWQEQAALHVLLAECARRVSASDHVTRGRIQEAWTMLTAVRAKSADTVSKLAAGETPGPEVSVDKILLTQAMQLVHDIEREIDPIAFALDDAASDELVRADWFYARAASIYGGAIDVQKGIVAERVLGLPRSAR